MLLMQELMEDVPYLPYCTFSFEQCLWSAFFGISETYFLSAGLKLWNDSRGAKSDSHVLQIPILKMDIAFEGQKIYIEQS